jgi:hypothetical protein
MLPRVHEEAPNERSEFATNAAISVNEPRDQEKNVMSRSTLMVLLGIVAVVAVLFSRPLTMGWGMMGGMGGTMCPM